jgi:hypothetical protein
VTQHIIVDEKIGFREGRANSNNIFVMKQVIEKKIIYTLHNSF